MSYPCSARCPLIALLAVLALLSLPLAGAAEGGPEKPNIVLVLMDNFGWGEIGWIDEGDKDRKLQLSKKHVMGAIRWDDQNVRAYGSLAFIHTVEGDYEAAAREFRRLRSLGQPAHWLYGIFLNRLARYEEAIEAY